MISIDIKGGEKEAFTFLDNLKLIKLAVSLGGTESLACHPYSMTHCDVSVETKNKIGMGESLVRISIGIEDSGDLIEDINNSLKSKSTDMFQDGMIHITAFINIKYK